MSEQKKNVLLVITNLDFGGAQTSFSKLSTELGKSFNVINVVFSKEKMADYSFGGPLLDLGKEQPTTWIGKGMNFWRRVKRLREIKRQHGINISISFLEGADYVNLLSGVGEKIIVSIRGSKLFDQNIRGLFGYVRKTFLMPYLYNRASAIVTVNKGIAGELSGPLGVKRPIHILHNFYDFEKMEVDSREPTSDGFETWRGPSPVICIMGRLAPEKGIDKFLPIFASLTKRVKNCKLLILGDGPERSALTNQAKKYGLSVSDSFVEMSDIIFAGYQPNPQRYVRRCTILVLPSLHEGFPNVLLEAMALKIPVAAADCPYGPREILEDEDNRLSGLLLPVLTNDSAAEIWIEELSSLLLDYERQQKLTEVGSVRANKFADSSTLNKWLEILEK